METSSSIGSSKRARALADGTPVPSCLVDGCTSDLSKCRDYHRRHKVCEIHSKTALVTVAGQEKRFCQQCSRFHSLGEFDEGKRSCRKRLEGHNRRRRKPQPEPMPANSQEFLSTYKGGSRITQSGQLFSASSIPTSAWAGIIKPENETMLYHSPSEINFIPGEDSLPLSNSYKGEKQFSFSQGTNPTLQGVSFCRSLQNSNFTSGLGGSSHNVFSDSLNRDINSGCALSLLSSPPPITSEIGLGHVRQPSVSPAQTLVPSSNGLSLGMEVTSLQSPYLHGSSSPDLNFQGISHVGPESSSTSGAHQTISFSWG